MSTPFIGIDNVNEFYGEHYLAAILAGDLKATLAGWRERAGEERSPPRALGALHARYFRFRDQLERTGPAEDRVALAREWWAHLLDALGFQLAPRRAALPDGILPALAEIRRPDGTPLLWVLPSLSRRHDDTEVLERSSLPELGALIEQGPSEPVGLAQGSIQDLVTAAFDLEEWPRFVLVLSEQDITLAERARWAEQRMLRFELDEVLGRREADTLDITAALLHRECLVPDAGAPLLDALDDSSHKHAFAVSEDLKYALRECIELLGNEAARQVAARAREQKKAIPWDDLAEPLSRECLRYMYRLLFLFYIEARPELGYAPMGSDAYAKGYSLERLRAVEDAELLEAETHGGTYLHDSVALLFRLIYEGAEPRAQRGLGLSADQERSIFGTFRLRPLRSHLFDPERTPLLAEVRFPNHVLRAVIEKMSLSRGRVGGGKGRRGRVSYATLGINQLGAVYEALLSFRGFFAKEQLFEVKPAGGDHGPLDPAYFVNLASLKDYSDDERVFHVVDGKRQLICYPKDTFVYRMAGRDRQKSASYYTPAVLTRATVKYALKEILEDEHGNPRLTSAEVLELKVLEPAVGSAAFLNEAVDQLAEAYLHRAQRERGERLGHERYAWEKQRVKMVLADNNVFGIDLNPVAIELAEISLWLNAIFGDEPGADGDQQVFVPWFGMQICNGNSLVGARRQVYTAQLLDAGRHGRDSSWLGVAPTRVPAGAARPQGSAWHFLLPDPGMATYATGGEGAPIQEMRANALAEIDTWKARMCVALDVDERDWLVELSGAVDRLWDRHVGLLRNMRSRTTDPLPTYGRPRVGSATSTRDKDRIWREELASEGVKASSPYRRLKLAMDYWCALWFWPIDKFDILPTRQEWLLELSLLLDQNVAENIGAPTDQHGQVKLFASTRPVEEVKQLVQELGFVDVPGLVRKYPRLALVQRLAERYRFFHWELEFADVFADRGGFDIVLGNPPWIKMEWIEAAALGDRDPSFVVHNLSAQQAASRRAATLAPDGALQTYLEAHEEISGLQAFLSSSQCYPELKGSQTNLYKGFLPRAWAALRPDGVAAFLHPESLYDEKRGGTLRAHAFPRLRAHYQFENELGLFQGTNDHGRMRFGLNVFGAQLAKARFDHIANLFHPSTLDACYNHDGQGPTPGIKDESDRWELRGHSDRIVRVDHRSLKVFAELFDDAGTPPLEARIPSLHASSLMGALARFRDGAPSIAESGVECHAHDCWHESRSRRAGHIVEELRFATKVDEWILNGPHCYVGTPFYKTPRRECSHNTHWDILDLETLPDDYLPRTKYVPCEDRVAYEERLPKVPWAPKTAPIPITRYYRVACNRGLSVQMERTLQPALVPPGSAHVDGVYTYTFADERLAVLTAGAWASLPVDFFIKSTGQGDFRPGTGRRLPLISGTAYDGAILARTLALSCLTTHYADLWARTWSAELAAETWTRSDARLPPDCWSDATNMWHRRCALRADYARRQALVEIDIIVAMALGMTLDQLLNIYRIQFPVLQQNERDTWYDRNGRIVYTVSDGLRGVGLERKRLRRDAVGDFWEDVTDPTTFTSSLSKTFEDDTLPGGPHTRTVVYQGPFDRCDREADYRQAWTVFARRFGARGTRSGDR